MIRNFIFVLIITLSMPISSFATEFKAFLNKDEIAKHETASLTLKLSGANAKAKPDLTSIQNNFKIIGQQQSTSVQVVQWQQTTTTSWKYHLAPISTGNITIPPITITTDKGELSTEELQINVLTSRQLAEQSKSNRNGKRHNPVKINVKTSDHNIYLKQPFIMALEIVESRPTVNLKLEDSKSPNYIVERLGPPQQSIVYDNNKSFALTKIKYLITPLATGKLELPTYTITGQVEQSIDDTFNNLNPHDIFHNFGGAAITNSFVNYEPFAVQSEKKIIEVYEPNTSVQPWLPASDLKVSDEWENNIKIKQGEPLSRTISISALNANEDGINLKNLFKSSDKYKVYADTPKISKNPQGSNIRIDYQQTFSIIPTEQGTVEIPELTLNWFDTENHSAKKVTLPPKVLQVTPTTIQDNDTHFGPNPKQDNPIEDKSNNNIVYFLLAMLFTLLLIIAALILIIFKQQLRKPQSKNIKTSDSISKAKSTSELYKITCNILIKKYDLPPNTSLTQIPSQMIERKIISKKEQKILEEVFSQISKAKYKDINLNLDKAKDIVRNTLDKLPNKRIKKANNNDDGNKLNPT